MFQPKGNLFWLKLGLYRSEKKTKCSNLQHIPLPAFRCGSDGRSTRAGAAKAAGRTGWAGGGAPQTSRTADGVAAIHLVGPRARRKRKLRKRPKKNRRRIRPTHRMCSAGRLGFRLLRPKPRKIPLRSATASCYRRGRWRWRPCAVPTTAIVSTAFLSGRGASS